MHKKMPSTTPFLVAAFLSFGSLISPALAQTTEPVLIWSDEFEVPGAPDPSKWLYDVGGGGWGNNEAQYYTEARPENARVENGVLIIEARDDGWPLTSRAKDNSHTSARLVSKGQGDFLYGRFEARAKMPAGRGTWPAIWMLPTGNAYGIWPRSGEIDIMEHVGFEMNKVHGSLHTLNFNWSSGGNPTDSTTVPNIDTEFYVYSVDWTPEAISFAVDGEVYFTQERISENWEDWPFDQPFYLILNLAVGGFWGVREGIDPDIWPQRMEIDYVRVYDLGDTVTIDTDGDGTPNLEDPDDDGDGLSDVDEHAQGTNVIQEDSDDDGFSDGDEVAAGTNPLLSSSYPGADPSILLVNPVFEAGPDPWIVHSNFLNEAGNWVGQVGSWGGAYGVFDFVTVGENALGFAHFKGGNAPRAEHLLYQEWVSAVAEIEAGDVIRFRGTASLQAEDPDTFATAFIRILDFGFVPTEVSAEIQLSTEPTAFALEATIGEEPFNVMQVGFLINGAEADPALITFSNLEATINEDTTGGLTWAGWPVEMPSYTINTEGLLGWLDVEHAPWVFSFSLERWIYLPEENITPDDAWVYLPR